MISESKLPEFPFKILINNEDLRNQDPQVRKQAAQQIKSIAQTIGPERTRKEMMSALLDLSHDDDDVLMTLAEQLTDFVNYVGGIEHAHSILNVLEILSTGEETAVRNKAVESITQIFELYSPEQLKEHAVPLVQRLVKGEWFTSRCSGARLLPLVYACGDKEIQYQLKQGFLTLCADETPMVRRAASLQIGEFCTLMPKEDFKSQIMTPLMLLLKDDVDFVRINGFVALIKIMKTLTVVEIIDSSLKEIIKALFIDKSWRVRFTVATHILDLQEVLGTALTEELLVPLISTYLSDVETEVKVAMIAQLQPFCENIQKDQFLVIFNEHIYLKLTVLLDDAIPLVRANTASIVLSIAKLIGSVTSMEKLEPLLSKIFDDESSEVRLNAITNLCSFYHVVGEENLSSSIIPAIIKLSSDAKWRVRLAVIECIPTLATQLGISFFNQHLGSLCVKWLDDNVNAVREVAAKNIVSLTKSFGEEWSREYIFPKFSELESNSNYLRRLTAIFLLQNLYLACTREDLKQEIMGSMYRLSTDKVANVRFNIAKSFKLFAQNPINESGKVREILNALLDDSDIDVKYFSEVALAALNSLEVKA